MTEATQERQAEALLITAATVASMLSIGTRTLWRWISDGSFPPPDFRRNERVVRWKRSTVLAWIESNAVAA